MILASKVKKFFPPNLGTGASFPPHVYRAMVEAGSRCPEHVCPIVMRDMGYKMKSVLLDLAAMSKMDHQSYIYEAIRWVILYDSLPDYYPDEYKLYSKDKGGS